MAAKIEFYKGILALQLKKVLNTKLSFRSCSMSRADEAPQSSEKEKRVNRQSGCGRHAHVEVCT